MQEQPNGHMGIQIAGALSFTTWVQTVRAHGKFFQPRLPGNAKICFVLILSELNYKLEISQFLEKGGLLGTFHPRIKLNSLLQSDLSRTLRLI